jgi:hypothetical protein
VKTLTGKIAKIAKKASNQILKERHHNFSDGISLHSPCTRIIGRFYAQAHEEAEILRRHM